MATAKSVLIVTATAGFGVLIQKTLEATGLYKVMPVDSDQEALLCIQAVAFSVAILDSDLPNEGLLPLAISMRQKSPRMRLIFICTNEDPILPSIKAFHPEGLLSKPLHMPELLETVGKVLQTPSEVVNSAPKSASSPPVANQLPLNQRSIPLGLQDVNQAVQRLARLMLDSDAREALILKDGLLWANAGQFPKPATQELFERLSTFLYGAPDPTIPGGSQRSNRGDMIRLIRLESTKGEYLVFATSLDSGMVLSLAFDSSTRFSTIRTQAGYLVKALVSPPETQLSAVPRAPDSQTTSQRILYPGLSHPNKLSSLLNDIPTPSTHKDPEGLPISTHIPEGFTDASAPVPPDKGQIAALDAPVGLADTQPTHPLPSQRQSNPIPTPNPALNLRPISPSMHSLTYAGMLIPRLPKHQLNDDLAARLGEWLGQLCLAFGWQVEQINVQLEYFQCIIRVNPFTSPSYLMRIIRQQTSQRIFNSFPLLAQDNPSGDFWAPGYLIICNSQLPPENITQLFHKHTRQQQGAYQPVRQQ